MAPMHVIIDHEWSALMEWEIWTLVSLFITFLIVSALRIWLLKRELVGREPFCPLPVVYITPDVDNKVTVCSLVLFALCIGKGYACLSPHDDGTMYVAEGKEICFKESKYIVQPIHYKMALNYWFDTYSFDTYMWKSQGCLEGLCGSERECSAANSREPQTNGNNMSYYVKRCMLLSSSGPHFCFYRRSCWIWTQEVYLREKFEVFKISGSRFHDQNTFPCQSSLERSPPFSLVGQHLVKGESGVYLCSDSSRLRKPEYNMLGDIQASAGQNAIFDTDWKCMGISSDSDLDCQKPSSFMRNPDTCSQLPGIIGEYYIDFRNNALEVTPNNGWKLIMSCKDSVVPDNNSTCHDISIQLIGTEGANDDSVAIKIRGHSDGLMSVNVSCLEDAVQVECDNNWHTFPIEEIDHCSYKNESIHDMRIRVKLDPDSSHKSITMSTRWFGYPILILLAFVCLGITVFRVVRKLLL